MSKKDKKDKKLKLQDELTELQNKYLLTLAELENTRKRMQKEKTEALSFAIENTISEFLPLIDNFENALNFATDSSEEVKNWALGFQMILSQIKDILHNHGIVAYHSVGNNFDPHYHDAVEIVESNDHEPGSIIEELAKGYKSATRVIRPARVKVTKKPLEKIQDIDAAKNDDEPQIDENENINECIEEKNCCNDTEAENSCGCDNDQDKAPMDQDPPDQDQKILRDENIKINK
ncbi:MAG TPA: nucleotide exchange factor GrpE [Chlamydiae bacterium]|nr:nucleotide exchange factor GrpE [Chlamydiota bacterium]